MGRATARARVEPEGGDIAVRPQLPATGHEPIARLWSWREVHVAVGRGNDDVRRDRPRQWVFKHDVDHVHREASRMNAVPLEDLLVQGHGTAGNGDLRVRRWRHVNRRASVDAQTDEGRTFGPTPC